MKTQTDEPGFIRDHLTGGLLNTDNEALAAYKARRNRTLQTEQRLQSLEGKLDMILKILSEKVI